MNFIPENSVSRLAEKNALRTNSMNFRTFTGLTAVAGILAGLTVVPLASAAPKKVLVVTTTTGFRHSSIPTAEKVLGELAKESAAFTVEYARVEPNDPQFKGADGKPDKEKVEAAIAKVLAEKMSPAALKTLRRHHLCQHDRRPAAAGQTGVPGLDQIGQGLCGHALGHGHLPRLPRLHRDDRRRVQDPRRAGGSGRDQPGQGVPGLPPPARRTGRCSTRSTSSRTSTGPRCMAC